jgi:hypothetical protein
MRIKYRYLTWDKDSFSKNETVHNNAIWNIYEKFYFRTETYENNFVN